MYAKCHRPLQLAGRSDSLGQMHTPWSNGNRTGYFKWEESGVFRSITWNIAIIILNGPLHIHTNHTNHSIRVSHPETQCMVLYTGYRNQNTSRHHISMTLWGEILIIQQEQNEIPFYKRLHLTRDKDIHTPNIIHSATHNNISLSLYFVLYILGNDYTSCVWMYRVDIYIGKIICHDWVANLPLLEQYCVT